MWQLSERLSRRRRQRVPHFGAGAVGSAVCGQRSGVLEPCKVSTCLWLHMLGTIVTPGWDLRCPGSQSLGCFNRRHMRLPNCVRCAIEHRSR